MANMLRKSTAEIIEFGPFLNSTNGDTEETALTLLAADVLISKNHAALTAKNDATDPTGGTNGHYQVTLNSTDTGTAGALRVYVHKTGALPVWRDFEVVNANVYDSMTTGTDKLQVDLIQIGSVAQSATDLKDFADAGYNPATNAVLADIDTIKTQAVTAAAGVTFLASVGAATVQPTVIQMNARTIQATAYPTNFGDLAISLITGKVTVGTNDDKTGYSLTQAFPTNFAALGIEAGGAITTLNGHTAQTGDSYARLGAPAGVSIAADLLVIDNFVDGLEATIGAAGAGLTDLGGMSVGMKAEVNAEADTAIVDAALSTAANLATVDTVVAAVKVVTDKLAFTVANQVNANVLSISGSSAAADNLEASAEVIITGAATAGTLSTTQMSTDLSEATNDHYNGRAIIWTSGVLLGQPSDITGYVGVNGVLTFTAVTEAPSAGDSFVLV